MVRPHSWQPDRGPFFVGLVYKDVWRVVVKPAPFLLFSVPFSMAKTTSLIADIKEAAEADLVTFIKLLAPKRLLGSVHEELCHWWTRSDAKSHQLVLLPRGHQKSAMIAYRVAWEITRNPSVTILYVSATADLAEKQLKMIQDILTSPQYRKYWPDMVNEQEGKREKWTASEISVDHPSRKIEGVRDPTVFARGLTSTITGLHCDVAVLDDIVVQENAYSQEGRQRVAELYSLLSSIENPGALEWAVGTRYHPKDLYSSMMEMEEPIFAEDGVVIGKSPVYEVFERVVEDNGDGTGEFLWPMQRRPDGKWFGFSREVLAKKKAQYLDQSQFRAQYYNDPNDPDNAPIDRSWFDYYDKSLISFSNGRVLYHGNELNVVAAIDFSYTKNRLSDYTALVVIGVDASGFIYILDIKHFQTDKLEDFYTAIKETHLKWGYQKIRVETSAGQGIVVRELKDQYARPEGLPVIFDEFYPTRHDGKKEDRISAVLEPRYRNRTIKHYKGGNCQTLEEELVLAHPPHDDIKDALANAVQISSVPTKRFGKTLLTRPIKTSRFGGW